MDRIEPLIPGVRNPLDIALGWIHKREKHWEKKLAKHETARAETQWVCEYIAAQALTMQHAPLEAREAVAREIIATMRDAGLWPPAEITPDELTEPTA